MQRERKGISQEELKKYIFGTDFSEVYEVILCKLLIFFCKNIKCRKEPTNAHFC
jgi:hypothetical protein